MAKPLEVSPLPVAQAPGALVQQRFGPADAIAQPLMVRQRQAVGVQRLALLSQELLRAPFLKALSGESVFKLLLRRGFAFQCPFGFPFRLLGDLLLGGGSLVAEPE